MVFAHRLPDGFFRYILGKRAGKGPRGVYRALRNVTGAGVQSEHRVGGESDCMGEWTMEADHCLQAEAVGCGGV